ncbi:DUF6383 domain-containing protein, partial [Parabacteroides leei]
MNKKFSTLVAVLLAAGAWTTLDARVIEVTKPAVGQAVVIGSNLDGTGEGSVIYLNAEGHAAAVEKEVTAETATWELEAVPTVESKSEEVAVKYYLKTKNAKGEAVYLLQTQVVESKSGDSYTYSVGAKEDGVTPVEISIVEGRIQVVEGDATKNLKFGESAITAESVDTKAATELTTVKFGVYSADDVFPGTGDVAVNEDGEVTDLNSFVENAAKATASFYLQVEGGYLYVDGGEVKVSEKVSATAAYSWTLDADKKMYSVALDRAKSDVKYLGVKAETKAATTSWTLVKAAAATEVTVADGALTVGTATISGVSVSAVAPTATNETITVGGQTLALQASFNNGEYYFISGNNASKAWKGEEDGTVSATTAVNADKCLWAVEDASANGVTRYKFKNKATGKYAMLNKSIEFVYTAAYNSGMYLSIANGANLDADLTNTTDAVSFGIYKSTTENVDAKELNDVLGNGFGLSILKVKDSKDKVEGMDAFDGKLTAIVPKNSEAKDVETFQLVNGDKYVALTLANEWGVENTGVNKRGGKFVLIDGKELAKNADKYLTYFTIKRYSGVADNLIDRVSVSDKATAATDTRNLYIMKLGEDLVLTSTVSTITGETYPYITLGLNNVASVKQFLGTFWNISFAATKSEVTEANEYKVGRAFAIEDNAPEYVSASSVEAGFPEAQWAVTDANLNTNAFTLANRETKAKIENVVLRETSEKNVYIVESVEVNKNLAAGDKIKLTAYEDPTMFDGFMQATENALRNQKYYMGQYHAISGNKNVYFSENHQKSHQLGVVTDKNEATLWNLSFRMKDYDGGTKNAVDTVFVETVFATLIDGKIVTDPDNKKVEKSKLAILPYQFQNRSNNEYVVYNDGQGYKFYVLNPDKKKENAYSFALKKQPNGTYNIVQFKNADNENTTTDERHAFDSKIYVANSEVDGFGELRQMGTYATDNNSLMVVEKADAPEYHKIAVEWGDTISLYREENNAQVLYEKRDNKSVVEKDTLSFLNIDNINQFSVNPAIFADTAYINRTIDGEANTCYQYLLAVNVDKEKTHYCPYNPEHNTDEWLAANGGPCADAKEHKAVKGRFLVNLIDTANVYGATHLHNNPYVNEVEAGESRAKLSFVEGVHADDTLYITRKGGEIVKLAMDTTDFNVAKFAFRYVDNDAKTFKIQTQWKNYFPTEDAEIVEETANNDGYLKWINGTLVVENGFENGDVFGIEENVKRDPVANEDITTSSISVIAKEGAVIIKGAAGKKVTISNVL